MSQRTLFEVQTYFSGTWENCWQEDDVPQVFLTYDEAQEAIHEFFADLWRAGMGQSYDFSDYRVQIVDSGAVNG